MSQIIVVDAGGQYCHLIARRIRELGVQATVCAPERVLDGLRDVKGIIISGGPKSVYEAHSPKCPPALFESGVPILGICYGHQLMAHALGGLVGPGKEREYGEAELEVVAQDTILQGLRRREPIWMSHGDEVIKPPPGFLLLGRTETCRVAAMANPNRRLFGVQFHPEVAHTPCGSSILKKFLFAVCHCVEDWDVRSRVPQLEEQIRDQVGDRNVLFFVSGGVDSTVAFTLCSDALGPDRVQGVFVDTGFMRKGERHEIERTFVRRGWDNILYIDAQDRFLGAIKGITDSERKRLVIGDCFLEVQRAVEQQQGLSSGRWMLGQGTIYPDTIESASSPTSDLIKTHHNRVPGIERLIREGLLVEPLRHFYKDEVRLIGEELGLPETMVWQQPFPGPGLAVRCLCSEDDYSVESAAQSQEIARTFALDAWTVHLRTVGVQGDQRSYSNLVILTGPSDLETYGKVATRITSAVRGTNRVAFLVHSRNSRPIRVAHVRKSFITRERLDLLREADWLTQSMLDAKVARSIWQFPVVLLPLQFGTGETIALRPVRSTDAMTAKYADLPLEWIRDVGKKLCTIPGVDAVIYDVTNKPPATIEWE